jgi:hypothetical protein
VVCHVRLTCQSPHQQYFSLTIRINAIYLTPANQQYFYLTLNQRWSSTAKETEKHDLFISLHTSTQNIYIVFLAQLKIYIYS